MSSHLSLTGLLPSAKKTVSRKPSLEHRHHQSKRPSRFTATLTTTSASGSVGAVTGIRAITNKAPLTIRPFAAIYNPYSKGCSVLCNHPATAEIKNVVKHAKQSWKQESGNQPLDDHHHHLHHQPQQQNHPPGRRQPGQPATKSSGVDNRDTRHGTGKLIRIMEYEDIHDDDIEDPDHRHNWERRQRRRFYEDPDYGVVVPEEFLRRFTDTDSRPMTPTPTVLSNKTRASHHSSRRCVTPEPQNTYTAEKKQIILDLRRSHSQETLFWNASSEFSAGHDTSALGGSCRRPKTTATTSKENATRGAGTGGGVGGAIVPPKKMGKRSEGGSGFHTAPLTGLVSSSSGAALSLKPQARGSSASSTQQQGEFGADEGGEQQRNQMQKQLSCIYSKDDLDEEPRRRGKKKKRGKGQPETSTFRPSQDPETQMATVPPDSTTQSQRPSIVTGGVLPEEKRNSRGSKASNGDLREALGKMSFLDESLLSQLRRGLSIEAIETNFQLMMQRALKEAFKGIPFEQFNICGPSGVRAESGSAKRGVGGRAASSSPPKSAGGGGGATTTEPESIRGVKEALNLPPINHDKWLTLPRKYTRMVSRFELPIDSLELSHLSPVQYLSKYVQVSNYRKQLYHRIFTKYIPEIKLDDFGEINLPDWNSSPEQPTRGGGGAGGASGGLPAPRSDLINHGIPATSSPDGSVAISELYMNQRFIPFDQLKAAMTTVLCSSASEDLIENILDMLLLSHQPRRQRLNGLTDDATEEYHYRVDDDKKQKDGKEGGGGRGEDKQRRVDEIPRNSPTTPAVPRSSNGIIINMSASPVMSSLSAADYVPAKAALQINRNEQPRNAAREFNIPTSGNGPVKNHAGQDVSDGEIDSGKISSDCDGNVDAPRDGLDHQLPSSSVSFHGTAAMIVALSSAARFGSPPPHCFDPSSRPSADDENLTEEIKINFRTWCGIVAFAERYTTNILKENDARHEIEKTDFESLDRRINGIPIHPNLKQVLYIIKN